MSGNLTHSPAEIVLEVLIATGNAARVDSVSPVDWMVFQNKTMPAKVLNTSNFLTDKLISVYDTTGIVNGRNFITGEYDEFHGVMIMLRLNEFEDNVGFQKAKSIQHYLDTEINRYTITVDSSNYIVHQMRRTSDIIRSSDLDDDSVMGLVYTLNYLVTITED